MSDTERVYLGEGYYVTDQYCEEPGCDRYLGVNYPSDYCDEHRSRNEAL